MPCTCLLIILCNHFPTFSTVLHIQCLAVPLVTAHPGTCRTQRGCEACRTFSAARRFRNPCRVCGQCVGSSAESCCCRRGQPADSVLSQQGAGQPSLPAAFSSPGHTLGEPSSYLPHRCLGRLPSQKGYYEDEEKLFNST